MSPTHAYIFTPGQWAVLGEHGADYDKKRRKANQTSFLMMLAFFGLVFVVLLEYAIFYEVYSYLKAPLPGTVGQWNVGIMALTGFVVIIAAHAVIYATAGEQLLRFLRIASRVLIPVYAIGAGLLFAAILYSDGADALIRSSGQSLAEQVGGFLGEQVQRLQPPEFQNYFEQYILPWFPIVFVVGAGSVSILTIYVGHQLFAYLHRELRAFMADRSDARSFSTAITRIRELEGRHGSLVAERDALDDTHLRDLQTECADEILAKITEAASGIEKVVTHRKLFPHRDEAQIRLFLAGTGLSARIYEMDLPELERLQNDLKDWDYARILQAIRADEARPREA